MFIRFQVATIPARDIVRKCPAVSPVFCRLTQAGEAIGRPNGLTLSAVLSSDYFEFCAQCPDHRYHWTGRALPVGTAPRQGYTVYGLIRGQNNPKLELVEHCSGCEALLGGDLTDIQSLLRALEVSRPDGVYNLGAISLRRVFVGPGPLDLQVTGAVC